MKLHHVIFASMLVLSTGSMPAAAAVISYNVLLSGAQSVPANTTTASGSAFVVVDDIADTVSVTLTFTGLTGGNASAAHIHCCSATNATAAVVIPFTGFPNTTSGTYTNLFTNVNSSNIAGIEAGLAYINIHNTTFPGGEIRGDILAAAVPEPGLVALFGLGLFGLSAMRSMRPRFVGVRRNRSAQIVRFGIA